ncbi:MAG TPA: lytic transglycosylase domain-containing protein [Dissulfurispiraceae bacterium]|nr:lytic transglycosylase domain-containing protein [Dissulfurispiraceae bacterium]
MRRLFILVLLLLSLSLSAHVFAAEELHAIKEKAATGKMYERALQFFTEKIPEAFEKKLSDSQKYIDITTRIFIDKDIPPDLAYLPLIESGFSPLSVGRGDAVGLWQLVKGTAKRYGLRIDRYVDERKDPVKSTYAAANYLRDLYEMFGGWDIALAAYNAGDGKIRHLLSKYKDVHFPGMVNHYMAKFMAAATVAQDPESYGLAPYEDFTDDGPGYSEVITDKSISLRAIAGLCNTTVSALKELNPALITNRTPPYQYVIRLPNP